MYLNYEKVFTVTYEFFGYLYFYEGLFVKRKKFITYIYIRKVALKITIRS